MSKIARWSNTERAGLWIFRVGLLQPLEDVMGPPVPQGQLYWIFPASRGRKGTFSLSRLVLLFFFSISRISLEVYSVWRSVSLCISNFWRPSQDVVMYCRTFQAPRRRLKICSSSSLAQYCCVVRKPLKVLCQYIQKVSSVPASSYMEVLPHIWLCTRSHLNFLRYEETFVFLFISAGHAIH